MLPFSIYLDTIKFIYELYKEGDMRAVNIVLRLLVLSTGIDLSHSNDR